MQKRPSILFICAGSSARSQMAAGFLRNLAGDSFDAYAVGISSADPGPETAQVTKEIGIDITGQKPKSVRESLKQHFSYVVSIAEAARERSPIFPFTPKILKWDARNPSTGPEQSLERVDVYRRVRNEIKPRVQGLVRELTRNRGTALGRIA